MSGSETKVFSCDETAVDDKAIAEVAQALNNGAVIGFPTETVYGIGCLDSFEEAKERIFYLKSRSVNQPLAYYINSLEMLGSLPVIVPEYFSSFAEQFLPGPVTVIFKGTDGVKYGVRYSASAALNALISQLSSFLRGTSANVSGKPSSLTAQEVFSQFNGNIDYIIDTGKSVHSLDSNVIDMSSECVVILRKGAGLKKIEKFFCNKNIEYKVKKKILVVCTGNTCRSPMVQGWVNYLLHEKGLGQLYDVSSCGIYAPFNVSAAKESIASLAEEGIDISWHKSKTVTETQLAKADKILVMTKDHEYSLSSINPNISDKIKVLEVPDPIGRGLNYYKITFALIKEKIEENWAWIVS